MFYSLKIHVRKSDTNTLHLHHYLKNIIIGNILMGGTGLCKRHIMKEPQDSFQALGTCFWKSEQVEPVKASVVNV